MATNRTSLVNLSSKAQIQETAYTSRQPGSKLSSAAFASIFHHPYMPLSGCIKFLGFVSSSVTHQLSFCLFSGIISNKTFCQLICVFVCSFFAWCNFQSILWVLWQQEIAGEGIFQDIDAISLEHPTTTPNVQRSYQPLRIRVKFT